MTEQTNILTKAISAALKAGEAIMAIYNDPTEDFGVERKADNSPLTKADKAAHGVIVDALTSIGFPILSEEGREMAYSERAEWGAFWMVDPLDGTKEFIKRNGEFTVNIALIEGGTPTMGVVYVPALKDLYFAAEGVGSFKIAGIVDSADASLEQLVERAMKMPFAAEHEGTVVIASRSHMSVETEEFVQKLTDEGHDVKLLNCGSSRKICLVAEGTADFYPRFAPTMEWDTAAGHAVAKYAACEVTHTDGIEPLVYNKENLLNPFFLVKQM